MHTTAKQRITLGRLLGIDYGTVRIGLALTDPMKIIASAFKTISGVDETQVFNDLRIIIKEQEIEKIILGIPMGLKDNRTIKTIEVEAFAEKLKILGLPIEFWDESYSSVEAHKVLKSMGKKTGHNKEKIDSIAAAIVLGDYLRSIS